MNELFVRGIRLQRNQVESFDKYPFCIPLIRGMEEVEFRKPVTFLMGENGSGKSTILEAIAVSMGMSAEGGSRNMRFQTANSTSCLHEYLTLVKFGTPRWSYFLRAESFYTMANAFNAYLRGEDGKFLTGDDPMHERSHGEEFSRIFNSFSPRGLYLLDEPESALSPKNQMRFLCRMHDLAAQGAQWIIVTHSPILLSYYDAEILNLDEGFRPVAYRDTEIYKTYRRFLDCPEKMQRFLFEE